MSQPPTESFEEQALQLLHAVGERQDSQARDLREIKTEMRDGLTSLRQQLTRYAPMQALDRAEATLMAHIRGLEERQQRLDERQNDRNERDRWFFRIAALVIGGLVLLFLIVLVVVGSIVVYELWRFPLPDAVFALSPKLLPFLPRFL